MALEQPMFELFSRNESHILILLKTFVNSRNTYLFEGTGIGIGIEKNPIRIGMSGIRIETPPFRRIRIGIRIRISTKTAIGIRIGSEIFRFPSLVSLVWHDVWSQKLHFRRSKA